MLIQDQSFLLVLAMADRMDEDDDNDSLDEILIFANEAQNLQTRSSNDVQVESMQDPESASDRIFYEFPVQIVVKNCKGQQQRTSHVLPVVQFRCQNVLDFKTQLWNTYQAYLRGIAIVPIDDTVPCSASSDPPDINDAHRFYQFEHGRKSITFESDGITRGRISSITLQTWSRKTDVVEGTLYTYSNSIQTQKIWEKFNNDILQPNLNDRAGAPVQELIDQLTRKIKDRFRGEIIL